MSDAAERDRREARLDSHREARLDEILTSYLEARERGEAMPRETLVAAHPELREEIERFLDGMVEISRSAAIAPGGPNLSSLDDYEIRDEIGRGGMGVVYRAWQRSLSREVALKVMASGRHASSTDRERFRREAEAAARLDHPNLVPIYDVGESEGVPYLSMKLIRGESLAGRSFPAEEGARIVMQVARAVEQAHREGILHRDLKPANILVDASGTPHVTDFGLARIGDTQSSVTGTGDVIGTPSSMSPEQAQGRGDELTPASDVFSLGTILYELLVARPAFKSSSAIETLRRVVEEEPTRLTSIVSSVPANLEAICLKCLEKSPSRRYGDAGALADDLDRFLRGEPVVARPVTRLERCIRWCLRERAATAIGGLLLVLAVGALGVALLLQRILDESRDVLRSSYLEQARAYRGVEEADLRGRGLAAVRSAAAIRSGLDVVEEAFACMALVGLEGMSAQGTVEELVERALGVTLGPDLLASLGDSITLRRLEHDYVGFSQSGEFVWVVPKSGTSLHVWSTSRDEEVVVTPFPERLALTVSIAGDDQLVFAQGADLALWDLVRGGSRRIERSSQEPPTIVECSADGRFLAAKSGHAHVEVYSIETGELVCSISGRANELAWQPRGDLLAIGGRQQIQLWEIPSGRLRRTISAHEGDVVGLAFHPTEALIASSAWDSTVRLWDSNSGREILRTHGYSSVWLRFSPDADRVASVAFDRGHARAWRLDHGREFRTLFTDRGTDVDPRGRVLLCGRASGLSLIDAETLTDLATIEFPLYQVRWHPGGELFACVLPQRIVLARVARDQAVAAAADLWRVDQPRLVIDMTGESSGPGRIDFNAHGDRLAAVVGRTRLVVFDIDGEVASLRFVLRHWGIHKFSQSVDGRWIATAAHNGDGVVRIWSAETGEPVTHIETGSAAVRFSPDSALLLVFDRSGLRAISTETWKDSWALTEVRGVGEFRPDGGLLAVPWNGRTVTLVDPDVEAPSPLLKLRGRQDELVERMRFDPTGSRLYVWRRGGSLDVWDLGLARDELGRLGLAWPLVEFERAPPGRPIEIELDAASWSAAARYDTDAMVPLDVLRRALSR